LLQRLKRRREQANDQILFTLRQERAQQMSQILTRVLSLDTKKMLVKEVLKELNNLGIKPENQDQINLDNQEPAQVDTLMRNITRQFLAVDLEKVNETIHDIQNILLRERFNQ
jgi:hypothetical protein